MKTVHMTPQERDWAFLMGVQRNAVARSQNINDQQMGKQNPVEIDFDGMLAEMAFCKAWNIYPDFTIHPRQGGVDAITKQGTKVDVKATRVPNGRLLIHRNKKIGEVDRYVLAIIDGDKVNLVGFIDEQSALDSKYLDDLGHGEGFVIPRAALIPFESSND
jgi:hypothetical protein